MRGAPKSVGKSLLAVVLLALATAPIAAAALDVQEITLDNGLRIFVLERSSSPTFAAYYQFGVGGAYDPKGASGIAHLLEHMMFKGTSNVGVRGDLMEKALMVRIDRIWYELDGEMAKADDPFQEIDEEKVERLKAELEAISAEHKKLIIKNEYDELMTRAGGVSMNASTNWDVTNYFIQLPANRLEFWFRLEADRLLNPVFREFYSERDVVQEERRMRTENTAGGRAYEAMQTMLFTAHPYGVPVVGWPRDLQRLVRKDAMDYFTTYYSPSNCIMVIVGDVTREQVEGLAREHLGSWRRQNIPRLTMTEEPEQRGERRRVVEFDAKPQLRMAWRTVPEGHADHFALDVLSSILGGLWSSRLDKTVVQEERLASRAGTGHPTYKYGGYFSATGTLRAGHTVAELEAAIEREIARIQEESVTEQELERAKVATEAGRVQGLKSNLGQAFRIANSVFLSGGLGYMQEYEDRINAVTAGQVQEAARKYLRPQRKVVVEVRTVESTAGDGGGRGGVSHGRGGSAGARGVAHSSGFEAAMQLVRKAEPVTLNVPEVGKEVQRVKLKGGITVFIKEDHSAPSLQMSFQWLGGSNTTPVKDLAPFELAGSLLTEGGTGNLDPIALQDRIDELGMNTGFWIGSTRSGGSFWSLTRNFRESFDLAMEMLQQPRFDAERLATLKGQHVEQMRRRQDSPGWAVSVLMSHLLYKDHPRLGYEASRAEIEAVTPEEIRGIWERYMGRDNLFVTVVGDFESAEMLQLLEEKLGGWRKAKDKKREWITHDPIVHAGAFNVEKDLPQPAIRLSQQIDVDRRAPMEDHAAIEILNDILGGSGFRSRLMERLRSDEGLTYGIGSGIFHDGRPGVPGGLRISYQTRRDAVARSIESVMEEYRKIIAEQVSEPEVEEQIEAWRNRFIFRYTNDFFIVARLMGNELDDRPYDHDRQLLDAVQKITVADVQRVAKKYLRPENATIAIYGELTDEDKAALTERYGLQTLAPEAVFTGGWEGAEDAAPGAGGEGVR